MKLLLLKILFVNHTKDKGYVIPIVFALGLIMTLIGTISIFQSSDEEIISISQRDTSRALAAAEAGIARYREQINRYKVIAMYDACADAGGDEDTDNDWSGADCQNADNIVSWKTASKVNGGNPNIPNLNTYCPAEGSTTADNDNNVEALASRGWQNIGDDSSQGQYRLIDYIYNEPADADYVNERYDPQPTGTLIVEGRVDQNNTNLANEQRASVASIRVELPVQPGIPNSDPNLNPDDSQKISVDAFLNGFNPALWITGANDNDLDLGNINVNGNIVVTDADCDFSGNLPNTDDLFDSTNNSIIVDPRNVAIVVDPADPTPPAIPPLANVNEITLADLTTESLPINGATATTVQGDTVYYYKLVDTVNADPAILGNGTNLNLVGGNTINIRRGRKVVLFVEGNININAAGGNININPDSVNNSSHLEIYMTDATSNINFNGIYVDDTNGNVNLKALLHAPQSPVSILGSPDITFTGAMWVENWSGSSSRRFDINVDTADAAIAEDQYLNYTYVNNVLVGNNSRIADPIIAPPSQWDTQQIVE